MVDVVIPHYGDDETLEKCLAAFNGSTVLNHVRVENNNEENRGFTKAVNDGILYLDEVGSEAPYVAVVNNDTAFLRGQDPFYSLVTRMESETDVAISGPTIVKMDNHDQVIHAGGLQCFPNGVHKTGLISLNQCQEPGIEKWLSFVVVLIRKEALKRIGLLDERMWLICSDSDFCYRARYCGYKCAYEPGEVWTHEVGESGQATSDWSYKVQRRDAFRFFKKWISEGGIFLELDREVV